MTSGIYEIRNTVNGKRYIGSAVDICRRFIHHRIKLVNNAHHSAKLQNAWNKHGQAAFEFVVLLECAPIRDVLLANENLAFSVMEPEYNICKVAGSPLGVKHSAETRAKVSAASRGRAVSAATRAKMSAAQVGIKRGPLSAEHRAKIGAAGKGRCITLEHRAKIGRANSGKSPSIATRSLLSMALKGRPLSLATRVKMSIAGKLRYARARA